MEKRGVVALTVSNKVVFLNTKFPSFLTGPKFDNLPVKHLLPFITDCVCTVLFKVRIIFGLLHSYLYLRKI
ncbi:hypothetical protein DMR_09540 [Solidesulfovibrio magneticus RS-1]|uniref:Uncharacterized protein n=1 Tax=Solidesulfovibrio magneticus (strain ATCC 700980 / DSM 13731 / RS-1) TaxID=573370 RepID=C4XKQ4_SOLM1|nr:hypothetical protein DMR_09540 [Solidesulfovibrio magneticus RS-1]